MTQAYLYTFNIGIPGDPQGAQWDHIVEAMLAATGAPAAYGLPVKVASTGLVSGIQASGDTGPAATPFGWIVRPYPIQNVALLNDPLGTSTPPTSGKVNIMVRGYISAFLQDATVVQMGMPVYIRTGATSGAKLFGGVQSTSDGATTLVTNNTYFMGPADANGNVVIAVNI